MHSIFSAVGSKMGDALDHFKEEFKGPQEQRFCSTPSKKWMTSMQKMTLQMGDKFRNALEEVESLFDQNQHCGNKFGGLMVGSLKGVFTKQELAMQELDEGLANYQISREKLTDRKLECVQFNAEDKKQVTENAVPEGGFKNKTPVQEEEPPYDMKLTGNRVQPAQEEEPPYDMKLTGNRVQPTINPEYRQKSNEKNVEACKGSNQKQEQEDLQSQSRHSKTQENEKRQGGKQPQHISGCVAISKKPTHLFRKNGPYNDGKNGNTVRVSKKAAIKYSAKKEKEVESQLTANIEFLKYMRGIPIASKQNEWKQESPKKTSLSLIKEEKKTRMEELGFCNGTDRGATNSNSLLANSVGLPEIRSSRKNGKAFKPAIFSIYSIMKKDEVFRNSPA